MAHFSHRQLEKAIYEIMITHLKTDTNWHFKITRIFLKKGIKE